ncbi:PAS domain-containing sensor histidine kinase [Serratia marcescens]|uniref:PAS domain-containing sensor histidine kinase n=1 Tax=Serratia marcescens TaxID=615 RepID=UPI00066A19DD|nr:PAS domain S-box protein [Serratia marcescens]
MQRFFHWFDSSLIATEPLSSIALNRVQDAIYLIAQDLTIIYVNERACNLMGYAQKSLLGNNFATIAPELLDGDISALWWKMTMRPEGITFFSQHRHRNSELIAVQVSSSQYQHGGHPHVLCIVSDVREQKKKETILKLKEKQFRALVENSPDMVARFDLSFRCIYANPRVLTWFNRTENQIFGWQLTKSVPHHHAGIELLHLISQTISCATSTDGEITLEHQNRQHVSHVRCVPEFNLEGQLESVLAIGRDITDIRLAEKGLREAHQQLRLLTRNQEARREAERKYLASEIHDELGQHLTSIRVGLSLISIQSPEKNATVHLQVENLMRLVDRTIQVVRDVSTRLRPNMLNMGLLPALEWLRDEFNLQQTCRCILIVTTEKKLQLDDPSATAVFRVVQESLTNVTRHARASSVYIFVRQRGNKLEIEVVDNGRGFNPQRARADAWGLAGMKERAKMLQGSLTIDSKQGEGTRVRLSCPLNRQDFDE